MAGGGRTFTFGSFAVRLLLTLFIVLSAYNPTGYSYYHWLIGDEGGFVSKFVVGLALVSINILLLVTAFDALKLLGMIIVVLNYSAVVWWLHTVGAIDFWYRPTMSMSVLIGVAAINAAGLSFSLWMGRLSGLLHIAKY